MAAGDDPFSQLALLLIHLAAAAGARGRRLWRTRSTLVVCVGAGAGVGALLWHHRRRASSETANGEASAIAPMDYSRLIYATLIGWWIFAELPNPTTVAGAALIVVASVITMRSARQSETR